MRPTTHRSPSIVLLLALTLAGPTHAQPAGDPLDASWELARAASPAATPVATGLPPASSNAAGVTAPAAPAGSPTGTAWTDVRVDLTGGPYWNTRARLVVMKDGKRTSVSIPSATTDRLVNALQKVRREGGQVVELELKGHGAPEVQTLGGGTFLIASGRNVVAQMKNGKDLDIAPLLQATLAPTATINLNGCQTARGDGTVTEALSRALPGRTVSGGARFYQLGIPFTAKSLGTKKYFKDGRLQSRWWYWVD